MRGETMKISFQTRKTKLQWTGYRRSPRGGVQASRINLWPWPTTEWLMWLSFSISLQSPNLHVFRVAGARRPPSKGWSSWVRLHLSFLQFYIISKFLLYFVRVSNCVMRCRTSSFVWLGASSCGLAVVLKLQETSAPTMNPNFISWVIGWVPLNALLSVTWRRPDFPILQTAYYLILTIWTCPVRFGSFVFGCWSSLSIFGTTWETEPQRQVGRHMRTFMPKLMESLP